MKLFQANIWGGRLDRAISNLIMTEKPDFVNLQEVISVESDTPFSTLQNFQEDLKYTEVFFSPLFSFNVMRSNAEFGNAMLASYPMIEKQTIFTNLEYVTNFSFDEHDYNIRNLQHALFKIKGKSLHVLNHHGHHLRQHKNGDAETMRQCKMIADYIKTLDGAVILTGDFNLAPDSESINLLNEILTNLPVQAKLTTTRTPLTKKTEVCDYIFVNEKVKVKHFEASSEIISDHQALILDFDI